VAADEVQWSFSHQGHCLSEKEPSTLSFEGCVDSTVSSESRCALRLRYVDSVVGIEVAVEVCSFTVFSC
jgi:hypothetical protein